MNTIGVVLLVYGVQYTCEVGLSELPWQSCKIPCKAYLEPVELSYMRESRMNAQKQRHDAARRHCCEQQEGGFFDAAQPLVSTENRSCEKRNKFGMNGCEALHRVRHSNKCQVQR